jgi:hypothetical protein
MTREKHETNFHHKFAKNSALVNSGQVRTLLMLVLYEVSWGNCPAMRSRSEPLDSVRGRSGAVGVRVAKHFEPPDDVRTVPFARKDEQPRHVRGKVHRVHRPDVVGAYRKAVVDEMQRAVCRIRIDGDELALAVARRPVFDDQMPVRDGDYAVTVR